MSSFLYESAFNETVDVIIITDGSSGKIIDTNKACCSLLGYTKSELIGNNIFSLLENEINGEPSKSLQEICMFDSVLYDKNVKTKSGEIIPVDMIISIVDAKPGNYVMTSLRDVRERIKYQNELLRMNNELSESNASKDKLFSIIAHDLKNPMMALMGFSEIMSQGNENTPIDEFLDISNTLYKLSKDTCTLLENLLNWAQIQTKRIDILKQDIILYSVVSKIIDTFKPSADLKKIELISYVDNVMTINADANMFNAIIRNLISNSIKFSFENSHITIKAFEDTATQTIIVEDEGVGMEESYLENLFKVDVKTSRPGTHRESGTGLGLVLCNEFIKLHNGEIKVTSEVGKGTQFIIRLPK